MAIPLRTPLSNGVSGGTDRNDLAIRLQQNGSGRLIAPQVGSHMAVAAEGQIRGVPSGQELRQAEVGVTS